MKNQTISHYNILEELGRGGMGVVYKAQDTKLDRIVALKFLPAHLSSSADDKARFIQEAKSASALNHPNVCTIYAIEEHEGQLFIAMEYVDGQTLREKRGSLTSKQGIDIGIQIAEGLSAAHEKGVVHRDIKPENIMIRKDGIAQIMDFGLAKLRNASSQVNRLTKEGSTIGTAGYMSPEQIQGQDVDHRSDIFSFGVLLYELLTGQLPFKGVHETALAYEIVNVDPAPMSAVTPEIDPNLDAIVLECLEKDPNERAQSAKQVAIDLKKYRRESTRQKMSRITAARPVQRLSKLQEELQEPVAPVRGISSREIGAWASAALLLVLAGYLMYSRSTPDRLPSAGGDERLVLRSSIVIPDSIYIHSFGAQLGPPVISPNGRAIAFEGITPDGARKIYYRSLDELETRPLPETDGGGEPFWSPDGKNVAFFASGKLRKVDLAGGSPTTLAEVPNPRGGTWSKEGTIVYAPDYQSGLYKVSDDGKGASSAITVLDSGRHEGSHRWPVFLPDGKHVLYLARAASETGAAEGDAIFVASLDGTTKKMLVQSSFNPALANGYLLFARNSVLLAQRFNTENLSLEGDPIKLQEGILTDVSYNMAVYTVSTNGILVYQTGKAEAGARPMIVDRGGKIVRMIEDRSEQDQPRFSPDGKQVALYLYDTRSRRSNIWTYDLRSGGRRRLTTRAEGDFLPCWSADGTRIFFSSGGPNSRDIYEVPVALSGTEKFFIDAAAADLALDCSPDGKTLLLGTTNSALNNGDLWLVPATHGDVKPLPFQVTKFDEKEGRISRDGKWVAYTSNESGEEEVYIKPLASPGADPWKVSPTGGETPLWGPESNELLYVNANDEIVSAKLSMKNEGGEVLSVTTLFRLPPFCSGIDISPDGMTFVITRGLEMQKYAPLTLVLHWDEALKSK